MHRNKMDRPKHLRRINVQHPFSPLPLTQPLTLSPSTRNNQSRHLQTKQQLIALLTTPYLTSEWTDPARFLLHCDSLIGNSNLRHVDQNRKIHVRTVGGATAGDFSASLTNQSPQEDTSHAVAHIGTNDWSDTNYDKQLVTVGFRALVKQLVRVFPKAAIALTSILPLNSGYT